MRMIPADNVLLATHLLHHVHKLLLEDGVNGLDRDCCTHLRHRKDIDHSDCVVVNDLTHHESHDFEGHTSATMLHHLKQRQRGDVDLLSGIILVEVGTRRDLLSTHTLHHHHLLQILHFCLNLTKF